MRVGLIALAGLCVVAFVGAEKLISPAPRCCTEYCYSSDPVRTQNLHMNTKTAYQLVRGRQSANVPSGCTPSKFWLLARHGTRLPGTSTIEKMEGLSKYQDEIIDNYASGNQPAEGGLCEDDLALLADWRWDTNISSTMNQWLTQQGWDDLKGLAEHYKAQYPGLLDGPYSAAKYHFRHTNTQRAEASYQGFVEGLFGENAHEDIPAPTLPDQDTFLRPYEFCSKFIEQEDAMDSPTSELNKFLSSDLYQQVIRDVSEKAGYSSSLTQGEVELLFEMCFYELSWNVGQDSPWCSLFTLDQVKIFEYANDIEEWHLGGPATELNPKLTCELVQDMLARLDSPSGGTVSAYFSHSTVLQLFLTALGAAVDETPLRADNYAAQANRKWQTSQLAPLATNVVAVRYDCATNTRIQFWLNEKPLHLSWCANGLCLLDEVKAKLAETAAATCSTYYCGSGPRMQLAFGAILLFIVVQLFGLQN